MRHDLMTHLDAGTPTLPFHTQTAATLSVSTPTRFRKIRLPGGRTLKATPVFDTYWRFAYERQRAFMKRVAGEPAPWTLDEIIARHRFTNAYRASDRVSQYLIRRVIYEGDQSPEEVFFRTILFKVFNRIETWEHLLNSLGELTWRDFDRPRVETLLNARLDAKRCVYSAAYIMPSPPFGAARKHANHLRLLQHMMRDGAPQKVGEAGSLESVFSILRNYPSFGDFLAFQLAIDLNYGPHINHSEMDFVVAGPGARDGVRKCFADTDGLDCADVIHAVTDLAEAEFARLGLSFRSLWGRPLQLIDCQNLFCETDKYARVAHPEYSGPSGRTRIKQKFNPTKQPLPQWYPPKWGVQPPPAPKQPSVARQSVLF